MLITYYGHSCFSVKAEGKTLLFDPFITSNPLAQQIDISKIAADYIFISHGHEDHIADAVSIAKRTEATVVSNFFSTSFVNSEPASGENAHIVISSDWWIFLAASVPLTMFTLYIWYVWIRIQAYGIRPFWWLPRRGIVDGQTAGIGETNRQEKV